MPFVTLAVKANGDTISRAEVGNLIANLEWMYTPPAYRLYATSGNAETVETTLGVMDYAISTSPHYEWLSAGGGATSGTYHAGTGGLWVNVGDVASGLWLNGVMFGIEQPPTASSTYTVRRVQLRRGTGSVWTELADTNVRGDQAARRTSVHIFGVGTFDATTDRVEVRARTAGAALDVLLDRRWGVRFGSSGNQLSANYAAARQVSDTNNELRNAFNRLADNQLRIERRPSAQRWKSGSAQSITAAGGPVTVTMADSDWANDPDMITTANRIEAEQQGLYFVSTQVTFDDLDTGGSFAEAAIWRSNSGGADSRMVIANAPDTPGSSSEDTTVTVCDLFIVEAQEQVYTEVRAGVNADVQASRGTQMHATLMTSDSGLSSGRQVFAKMPHPDTWPNVAGMSSAHLPAGTLRALSDLTDRQWHRPAFKASAGDDIEISSGEGWTDVDCDVPVFDYTDLEGTHGITVFSGGALVLPWAGLWMVGARLQFSAKSADGTNIGNDRVRGMRIALGKKAAAGAILGRAMNAATHGWTRTTAETVVTNTDGVEVKLQGLVEIADGGAAVVSAGHLWAVELGAGITRDPR